MDRINEMSKCPHCHGDLHPDPKNDGKLLCYTCKKRYDAGDIERLENQNQANNGQMREQYAQRAACSSESIESNYPQNNVPSSTQNGNVPQSKFAGQAAVQPNQHDQYSNVAPGQQQYQYSQQLPKGLAIASLVLAVLGILGTAIPIMNIGAIVLAIVAIILGFVGGGKAKRGEAGGKGLATAGIIVSFITIILAVIVNIAAITVVGAVSSNSNAESIAEMIQSGNYSSGDIVNKLIDGENSKQSSGNDSDSDVVNGSPARSKGNAGNGTFWNDGKITINGKDIAVGRTTVNDALATLNAELSSECSVKIDDVVSIDNAYSSLVIDSDGIPRTAEISFGVDPADKGKKFGECIIKSVWYSDYSDNPKDFVGIPSGIHVGSSEQDVIKVFGECNDKSTYGDSTTLSYSTEYPDDYACSSFYFDNGKLDSFSMSCD